MFKHTIGSNHPEFSSGRQQDVSEFFTYLLDQLNRNEKVNLHRLTHSSDGQPTTDSIFNFHHEIKYKDIHHPNDVKFVKQGLQTLFNMLELPIPTDKAIIREKKQSEKKSEGEAKEQQEIKRQKLEEGEEKAGRERKQESSSASSSFEEINNDQLLIPFEACLERYFEPEIVELKHPVSGQRTAFSKNQRFATFPRYLAVKLSRYYIAENWTQKKINAEIPMPLELDLNSYRSHGLVAGEKELPEEGKADDGGDETFVMDESLVENLMSMGFSENGCRRAAIATKNADVETAMNWIMEHMEDPDFNSPAVLPSSNSASATVSSHPPVDQESVQMLMAMGYSEEQCTAALVATSNNIER
jgi:ubiquitin carboxyl-terminal hydrolase 5/13